MAAGEKSLKSILEREPEEFYYDRVAEERVDGGGEMFFDGVPPTLPGASTDNLESTTGHEEGDVWTEDGVTYTMRGGQKYVWQSEG